MWKRICSKTHVIYALVIAVLIYIIDYQSNSVNNLKVLPISQNKYEVRYETISRDKYYVKEETISHDKYQVKDETISHDKHDVKVEPNSQNKNEVDDKSINNDKHDAKVNPNKSSDDWLSRRRLAMQTSSNKKLIIFCHMRGGSSFFGEFFNQNPEVLHWYEPVDGLNMAIHGRRMWHFPLEVFFIRKDKSEDYILRAPLPAWEVSSITKFNDQLLNCDFSNLPVELFFNHFKSNFPTFSCLKEKYSETSKQQGYCDLDTLRGKAHSFCDRYVLTNNCSYYIRQVREIIGNSISVQPRNITSGIPSQLLDYYACRNYHMEHTVKPCLEPLINRCKTSKLMAYKAIRYMMETVDAMLQQTPDMYVIYLVRDPRSIVSSRYPHMMSRPSRSNASLEAKYLCEKMMYDYRKYQVFDKKYPGVFKLVKYEELVMNRNKTVEDVYKYLDLKIHPNVHKWSEKNMRIKVSDGAQGTNRANSTSSIEKWRKVNSIDVQRGMTNNCMALLNVYGYDTAI